MQTKTITYTLYNFDELSEDAKQKAIDWFLLDYPQYEWWDSIYEDAEIIGLKIESFDLDRNRHVKGGFIKYAIDCAESIIKEHGESCETYKTARTFIADRAGLIAGLQDDQELEDLEAYQELEEEFLKSILEDYSIMVEREYEYMTSEEHAHEMIKANKYTFDEHGNRKD